TLCIGAGLCLFSWLWANKGREYYQPDRLQPLYPHPLPERPGLPGVVGAAQGGVGGLTLSQQNRAQTGMPGLGHTRFVCFFQWSSSFPERTAVLERGVPGGYGSVSSARRRSAPMALPPVPGAVLTGA